jgi:hypothetical protein
MNVAFGAPATSRVHIKTAKVTGRRTLHFETFNEILEDAERLCSAKQITALGNWTLGQALGHLALAMDMAIDGAKFRVPWYVRLVAPLFKQRMLSTSMPSGVQLPADGQQQLIPTPTTSSQQGLAELRRAIGRLQTTSQRAKSPVFGRMSREDWDRFHLRHAELHLSFFVAE